jgi:hypothetical protein
MKGDVRLTPVGVGVVILLVLAVAAMLFGSHGLQAAGFVVVVLAACLGAMAFLSSSGGNFTVVRRGGYGDPSSMFGGRGARAASLLDPDAPPAAGGELPARTDPRQGVEPYGEIRSGGGDS